VFAVAVERRCDRMLRAAIPSIKELTVVRFEGQYLGALARDAVVLGIPADDRLALRLEELGAPENAPAEVEREKDRAADQQRACGIRKIGAGLFRLTVQLISKRSAEVMIARSCA